MCNFVIVTRATSAPWAERVAGPLCAHACATPGVGLHACLHFRLTLTSTIVVVACIACTIILKQTRPARNGAKPTQTMLCAAQGGLYNPAAESNADWTGPVWGMCSCGIGTAPILHRVNRQVFDSTSKRIIIVDHDTAGWCA